MSNDDFSLGYIDGKVDARLEHKGRMRIACALLTECEAIIGTVDPECTSEAELISKLRAQIVDFLADAGLTA